MLNKNQITEKDFEEGLNFLYIKENARKEITREMDSNNSVKLAYVRRRRKMQ